MKWVKKILWDGIKTVVPLAITIALVVWVLRAIESAFGWLIKKVIGPEHYFDGLGLLVGLGLVIVAGILMNTWLTRKVYSWGEAVLRRIPLVKTLYNAMVDLMAFFDSAKKSKAGYAVMVTFPGGSRLLGILTLKEVKNLGTGSPDEVAVYFPMSYQIGGYTLMVPSSMVERIEMSVEKAMSFAVTAGMTRSSEKAPNA
ncbi:MAG: DUF502 domain-containing protein [Parachlamydiales bacterium]